MCPLEQEPLEHLDDTELWSAYVRGNDAAFSEVCRRYRGELYWYLLLSLASPRRAAQRLAEVMGLAAAYRLPYEGFESLKGWLYAIATQSAVSTKEPEELGFADLFEGTRRRKPRTTTERAVYELADLKRQLRQPLLLVTAGGLSISEAARACNFTEEQAAKCIEKALRALSRSGPFSGKEPQLDL